MTSRLLALLLVAPLLLAAKLDDLQSFQRAQQMYGELEFEQAIFALQEAALAEDLEPSDRARVFAWLGLCHFQVRHEDEARRYFVMAVRADEGVALPTFAPPAVIAALDEVRAAERSEGAPETGDSAQPGDDNATPGSTDGRGDATSADAAVDVGDEAPLPWEWIGGAGLGVAGALSVAVGGVMFALSVPEEATARSEDAYQDEAIAAAQTANLERAGGSVLVIAGVALAGGGVALAMLPVLAE